MDRCAVFVDAGYLFAQGSAVLYKQKQQRHDLILNHSIVVEHLKSEVSRKASQCQLLRIYWYDGAAGAGGRPSTAQAAIAETNDVKLRLGFINSSGQQKGVDSLIVTDLIELARLKSISDAILLSGDEDLRIGVQIAQSYGVRVHLLGIEPGRGSQSEQLRQEADTTEVWPAAIVATFMSRHDIPATTVGLAQEVLGAAAPRSIQEILTTATVDFVAKLSEDEVRWLVNSWGTRRSIPADIDGGLLFACSKGLGKSLEMDEKRFVRGLFQQAVKDRHRTF
jgi:uncharacterized LabA/DUF88 family protein